MSCARTKECECGRVGCPRFGTAAVAAVDRLVSTMSTTKEAVNHPNHYGGPDNPYEVIKVLAAWGLEDDAILWNVIKYVARAGKKDPAKHVEDLEKALFYLDYRIKTLRNKK